MMGIGAGLHCYVAPIYMAEITPKNIRGGFTAGITFTVSIGFSLMFFFGNFFAWRNLALVGNKLNTLFSLFELRNFDMMS
nr:sugar transporter ERD6-like 5 isoform X1 [Ipomoea batatas]